MSNATLALSHKARSMATWGKILRPRARDRSLNHSTPQSAVASSSAGTNGSAEGAFGRLLPTPAVRSEYDFSSFCTSPVLPGR